MTINILLGPLSNFSFSCSSLPPSQRFLLIHTAFLSSPRRVWGVNFFFSASHRISSFSYFLGKQLQCYNRFSLVLFQAQYHDWIKLLEVVSRYKTYVEVSHLRPVVPVSEGPYLWWRYAAQAGLQQKKMW